MDKIFAEINEMDSEVVCLKKVESLQQAIADIKKEYRKDISTHSVHLLESFKDKMKNNLNIASSVEYYVGTYVKEEHMEEATEELYNMLAGEMVDTFRTLSHASCTIC